MRKWPLVPIISLWLIGFLWCEIGFGQYYAGALDTLPRSSDDIDRLLQMLKIGSDEMLAQVPEALYGSISDPNLPDLIVFYNTNGSVRIVLVQGGKKKNEVFGEAHVWVMAFYAEKKDAIVSQGMDTISNLYTGERVEARRDSLRTVDTVLQDGARIITVSDTVHHAQDTRSKTQESHVAVDKLITEETKIVAMPGSTGGAKGAAKTKPDGEDSTVTKVKTTIIRSQVRVAKRDMPDSIEFKLSPLAHLPGAGERILGSLVRAVGGMFNLAVGQAPTPETLKDSTASDEFILLGTSSDGIDLYYAIQKFPLAENSLNRVRVTPGERPWRRKSKTASATFGNHSRSFLGASIALSLSYKEQKRTFCVEREKCGDVKDTVEVSEEFLRRGLSDLEVEPYLFIHIYPQRPKLPSVKRYRAVWWPSVNLSLGTKITTENFLDDITIGLGFQHHNGIGGIFVGWNFTTLGRRAGDIIQGEPLFALYFGL